MVNTCIDMSSFVDDTMPETIEDTPIPQWIEDDYQNALDVIEKSLTILMENFERRII